MVVQLSPYFPVSLRKRLVLPLKHFFSSKKTNNSTTEPELAINQPHAGGLVKIQSAKSKFSMVEVWSGRVHNIYDSFCKNLFYI